MKTICLDPGHPSYYRDHRDGQINWGAVSPDGVREVEINLVVAKLLLAEITKNGDQAFLTRESNDQLVDNVERVRLAKEKGADFIIRLHCDQDKDRRKQPRGVRTFSPPPAAKNIYEKSLAAAKIIHQVVVKETGLDDGGIVDDRVASIDPAIGMLVGTKEADKYQIPTVLIEMVYLTNPNDTKWIINKDNQALMASAIAKGVKIVFEKGII